MSGYCKIPILFLLVLVMALLPMTVSTRLMREKDVNGPPTRHAYEVIDRYCQLHHMRINPDIEGPPIIAAGETVRAPAPRARPAGD